MVLALSILLAVFVLEEPWNWVAVGLGATFELAETGLLIWWSKRRRVAVGSETLVGRRAVVSVDCMPEGQVKVAGEIWQARCAPAPVSGEEVVVREVDGLTLVVEPALSATRRPEAPRRGGTWVSRASSSSRGSTASRSPGRRRKSVSSAISASSRASGAPRQ